METATIFETEVIPKGASSMLKPKLSLLWRGSAPDDQSSARGDEGNRPLESTKKTHVSRSLMRLPYFL